MVHQSHPSDSISLHQGKLHLLLQADIFYQQNCELDTQLPGSFSCYVGNCILPRHAILLQGHGRLHLETHFGNGTVQVLPSNIDGVLHHWICYGHCHHWNSPSIRKSLPRRQEYHQN